MNQEAEDVIARIETAFRSMKPGLLTLQQAHRAKEIPAKDFKSRSRKLPDRHWMELADEEIESCGKAFYGADIESWLSFVPAWMRWSLRNYDKSDSFVIDQVVYTLDPNHHQGRFAYFSIEQSHTIYLYLRFMSEQPDWVDDVVAQRSINNYWGAFASTHEA